jgi:hypothetical protein
MNLEHLAAHGPDVLAEAIRPAIASAERAGDFNSVCSLVLDGWRASRVSKPGWLFRSQSARGWLQRWLTPGTPSHELWRAELRERRSQPRSDLQAALDVVILAGPLGEACRKEREALLRCGGEDWLRDFGPPDRCIHHFARLDLPGAPARHLGPVEEVIARLEPMASIPLPADPETLMDQAIARMPAAQREMLGRKLDDLRARGAEVLRRPSFYVAYIEGLAQSGRYADAWALVRWADGRFGPGTTAALVRRLAERDPGFGAAGFGSEGPGERDN